MEGDWFEERDKNLCSMVSEFLGAKVFAHTYKFPVDVSSYFLGCEMATCTRIEIDGDKRATVYVRGNEVYCLIRHPDTIQRKVFLPKTVCSTALFGIIANLMA